MNDLIASNNDVLRKLNDDEVQELMELYKTKYSISNFHYILMYNQMKWNQQLKHLDEVLLDENANKKWIAFRKTFYTHRNANFRQHGTYVSIHWDTMQSISCHSWEPSLNELRESISKTTLIKWRHGPLLTNVDLPICDLLKETAASAGTTVQRARTCYGFILPHQKALALKTPSLPTGFIMKPLSLDNAELVHNSWANRKEGSLQYIKGLIELNRTLGIYIEETKELVAWIFQNDFSGLGILEVQPTQQRKGFGLTLCTQLTKEIAEHEEVQLSAWIVRENEKSRALLQKIGYQIDVVNEWIQLNRMD